MGWIGGDIESCDTKFEIESEWNSLLDYEIPRRLAGANSLKYYGEFKSEEEARRSLSRADICGIGYVKVNTGKESSQLRKAKDLLLKEQNKLETFQVESSVKNTHTGKTVGCTKCGSSFPVDYFVIGGYTRNSIRYIHPCYDVDSSNIVVCGRLTYINSCPICGADMRSETTRKRIAGYKENIKKYEKRVEELMKTEKNKPYYLYKVNAYVG